jgi:hypothetical protein
MIVVVDVLLLSAQMWRPLPDKALVRAEELLDKLVELAAVVTSAERPIVAKMFPAVVSTPLNWTIIRYLDVVENVVID